MEPERKIEKLLRAFAKKRRADAGDAFNLHPATRRLLQGEVARQRAEPPEEDSVSLWQLFWQQWAFLLSFALVIFFGAALFVPALSKAKHKARSTVAASQLRQIGVAAQLAAAENNGKLPVSLDALTNGFASAATLTDPVSGKRFVYVAGGEKLDELQSNSVLAYSPEDKKGRAVLLADGSVQTMNAEKFSELNRRGLVQRAASLELAVNDRPVPMAAPMAAAGTLTGGGGSVSASGLPPPPSTIVAASSNTLALATKSVAFKADGRAASTEFSLNNNSQRFVRTVGGSAKTMPVLASFEVQQNGNAIAVVDRDGSVYQGSLRAEDAAVLNGMPAPTPSSRVKGKDFSLAKSEMASAQNNYSFRVVGQNRTSKQNVVFDGNLIPLSNSTVNAGQNQTGDKSAGIDGLLEPTNSLPSQWLFSNSRITGVVTVDATNQIEINATPVNY